MDIVKVFKKQPTIYNTSKEKMALVLQDESWSHRIINEAGDVANVNMTSFQISCYTKKPILDFREEAGRLVPSPVCRGLFIKIKFMVEHSKHFE